MVSNCNRLVEDLCLFCYENDFKMSHYDDTKSDILEAFYSSYIYLDVILNIDRSLL